MRILYMPTAYSQQRQRQKKANIYPVRMAMEAEHYRKAGCDVSWGNGIGEYHKTISEPENLPFLSLPAPDRTFTKAFTFTSGNYKHLPGTHILSASGCWWGACSFCVEKGQKYEVRPVDDVIDEIAHCKYMGFREIFDDSATFPIGGWLYKFCRKVKPLKIPISCNMRCVDIDYKKMKDAGFRMLLFGIESANQKTLDKINKGINYLDFKYIAKAAEAGLENHIACMFGYPWETGEEALRTLHLVHFLLRKGYAKTAQASFYQPPDGKNNPAHKKYVKQIYLAGLYPDFWFNQLKSIRNTDDIKYILRGIKSCFGI
jgi:anaerobic magnesium-protoporphyrin IX monomethyl ester cyclase